MPKISKALVYFLYAVIIILVPLLFSYEYGFEYIKVYVFRLASFLLGFTFLVNSFFRKEKLSLDKLDWVSFLWVLFTLVPSIITGNFQNSFFGGVFRYQGVLTQFCLVVLFLATRRFLKKYNNLGSVLTLLIIVSGSLQSLILIFQWMNVSFLGVDIPTFSGRVVGTLGQPNFAAGLALVSFGLLLGSYTKLKKAYLILLLSILLAGVLVTKSWAEIFSSFLIILILVFKYFEKLKAKVFVCAVLVFLLSLAAMFGYKKELSRGEFTENPVESRLSIWPASFNLFLKRPLLGYGAENLSYIFPDEYGGVSVDRAHNALLDSLLVGGIFLGATYLLLVYYGLTKSYVANDSSLFLAFVAAVARDQVGVSSIVNLILFWLVLALIFSKRASAAEF